MSTCDWNFLWRGAARLGVAGLGKVRLFCGGEIRMLFAARCGRAWRGRVGHGAARQGMVF